VITIQYLEDSPELVHLGKDQVIAKLRLSTERLPFSHLLIGWHIPPVLLEACQQETQASGIRFLRWHPLLTGDGIFTPRPEWQVVGLTGRKVSGFRGMPEFTFVCPNHPKVQDAIYQRIRDLLKENQYQGFFLDRIRFPSPAADPLNDLGCFCEHCHRKAALLGTDLAQIRNALLQMMDDEHGIKMLVQVLLGGKRTLRGYNKAELLAAFLDFRFQSIIDFITPLSRLLRDGGMEIGLDCFSPSLTPMVGQDMEKLSKLADWVKIMSYAHTLGPAGIPFELLGFCDFLTHHTNLKELEALDFIKEAISLPLPATRKELESKGLSSQALSIEVSRGVESGLVPILAGIELVEIAGVANLMDAQLEEDLAALKAAKVGGLAISWDLWHIPVERLSLVKRIYLENENFHEGE